MQEKGIELSNSLETIKIEKLDLFKGIFNIIKDVVGQKYTSIPADVINTIQSVKLDETHGNIGWKLISRALVSTLVQLIIEKLQFLDIDDIQTSDLDKQLNELLNKDTYVIQKNFFKNPQKFLFLNDSKEIIIDFLKLFELENFEINNIMNRFNSYFILSLVDEYRTNINFYKSFENALNTPFNEAEENVLEWFRYGEWIKKQTEESVFGESFGLKQVYIPLKAYYIKEKDHEKHNIIIELEEELLEWVNTGNKDDAIRIIRGGPGYGKSSFFKMFASKLIENNNNVLFIPLHNINIENDMVDAVKKFLQNSELLQVNPFESDKLIIIFDGLDELTMQGKTISESANSFVREIQRQATTFNTIKLKLQILLSGRDIVIQQNESEFRKEKQIIRLLPYYLNEREQQILEPFTDNKSLLEKDQRCDWWKKYGKLKDNFYKGLPSELKNKELDDITSQPLLNYLIALSYERGEVNFKNETNLNIIYEDLLIGVYKRAYDDNTHRSLSTIKIEDFQRILEEIGLSTWHGDGRKTTVSEIEAHFKDGGLQKLLQEFIGDAEKGVVSLLASFYFKKSGETSSGDETFEFTHKSFGEFLTSKRIVASIEKINLNFEKYNQSRYSEEGWDIKESLTKWLKVFSTKEIDIDLHKFINNEIELLSKQNNNLEKLQNTISIFINYILENGLPVEKLDPRPTTFYKENKLSINAEKALLIMHGTIAKYTNIVSKINAKDIKLFGEWISRITGQRTNANEFILRFLNNLDLSGCLLYLRDFRESNLSNSIFKNTKFTQVNLYMANLKDADLDHAFLYSANLESANLQDANLKGADLEGANLEGASLKDTNLEGAKLEGTNLSKNKLRSIKQTIRKNNKK